MRNIIFDMDGVIIDSEPFHRNRVKRFMESKGFINISKEIYDETCGGNPMNSQRIFSEKVDGFDMSLEQYMKEIRAYNKENVCNPVEIVDHQIYSLLDYLKKKEYKIALASSSPKQVILRNLGVLNITSYFDEIISGMDFKKTKPEPEIYQYTMNKLNVIPQECLVVEDSTYGIQSAKAAEAVVIAKRDVRFGYDQTIANYIVDELIEVIDICEMLEKQWL